MAVSLPGHLVFAGRPPRASICAAHRKKRQVATRDGDDKVQTQSTANRGHTGRGFEFVDAPLGFVLDSRILRRLFRRVGPIRMYRNSADETLVV